MLFFVVPIDILSQAFSINLLSLSVFACGCLESKSVPPVYIQIEHHLVSWWLAEYFRCSIRISDCMMSFFSLDFLVISILTHNMLSSHKSAGVSYMEKCIFVCVFYHVDVCHHWYLLCESLKYKTECSVFRKGTLERKEQSKSLLEGMRTSGR